MKMAIVGAGALGGTFGALLTRAGIDVRLVEIDKKRVEAIQKNGLIMHMPDGSVVNVPVKITDDPASVGIMDLVQISVKGYHTESAVKMAAPMIGPETYVMSVQNGLGNLDVIAKYVPKERVIGGVTAHSAMALGLNEIKYNGGVGGVRIGRFDGKEDPKLNEIVKTLNDAGFETEVIVGNILNPIWRKLLANVACNCVAAITGFTGNQLIECEETNRLIRELAVETYQVAKAQGLRFKDINDPSKELEDPAGFVIHALSGVGDNKISMLQDIEAGRRTEIDTLNGKVWELGEKLGVPTPLNKIMTLLVKAIEKKPLIMKKK